jgi:hypothetical protein
MTSRRFWKNTGPGPEQSEYHRRYFDKKRLSGKRGGRRTRPRPDSTEKTSIIGEFHVKNVQLIKLVRLVAHYKLDEKGAYRYVAFNCEGVLCGFANAPLRDLVLGQWVDSVTGSTGEMILFEQWDQSCREVADLADMSRNPPQCKKRRMERKNKF